MRLLSPPVIFIAATVVGGIVMHGFLTAPVAPTAPEAIDPATVSVTAIKDDPLAIAALVEALGVEETMQRLIDESSGGSVWDCHQPAHEIGRAGYQISQAEAFEACSAACHSGCYHGAIEVFLQERGTENLPTDIKDLCDTFGSRFGRFECLHGVGHGVTAYLDYDLPEAIKSCQRLGDWFMTRSCLGGMFMENILAGQGLGAKGSGHTTDWTSEDPYFPCNAIDQDGDVQTECYMMQTSWMLWLNGYDFTALVEECLSTPEIYQSTCFQSFGRDAAGHTLRNPARITELCALVPKSSDWLQRCTIGAVNVIIDFWGPGLQGQASELCRALPDDQKTVCYRTIGQRVRDDLFPNPDARATVCNTFEENYVGLCI